MSSLPGNPVANLAIFTGDEIMVHRGTRGKMTSILPKGVAKDVKRVETTQIFDKQLEALMVQFNNGQTARLLMNLAMTDPIYEEDLKEFKARCLMIHDL